MASKYAYKEPAEYFPKELRDQIVNDTKKKRAAVAKKKTASKTTKKK